MTGETERAAFWFAPIWPDEAGDDDHDDEDWDFGLVNFGSTTSPTLRLASPTQWR